MEDELDIDIETGAKIAEMHPHIETLYLKGIITARDKDFLELIYGASRFTERQVEVIDRLYLKFAKSKYGR